MFAWISEVISSPVTIGKIFTMLGTVSKLVIGFEDRFNGIEKRLDAIELGLAGSGIKLPSIDKHENPGAGVNV